MTPRESILELQKRMGQSIIGQEAVIERLLLALLCGGNVLLEGLPGLAKTRAVKSLAKNLECDYRRIQFTPDLLPADVTGSEIYYDKGGQGEFVFQPGPVFGNLILADEINRAPAKVQSSLLEAMEEHHVTVAGKTHKLPELFMVLATQNPIEQEGTYPLPEAQRDRFLIHVMVRYSSDEDERKIMQLVRSEDGSGGSSGTPPAVIPQQAVFDARKEIHAVAVAESVEKYMVAIIAATRRPEGFGKDLARWITVGASPRGTLALDRMSRALAWFRGKDHVTPDDVRAVALDCLRHRVLLSYEAQADAKSADDVLSQLIKQVAVA
ncbi:ATPase RavA [Caulifigura coniformis]|uniref:ATPase RavA n=1 Tax=Caulifigura coniformis TaxID=2527983 RepID=A0A517SK99_9PLAN|nr:MoxR family ATPase [Caulifigura coniformis]QDT56550.1 ATPase RavA [Caulifigura coniformis]